MDHNKYLEKYYRKSNPLVIKISIGSKLGKCIIVCILTTLIYLFMVSYSKVSKFKGEVSFTENLTPLNLIMIVTASIGAIGFIIFCLKFIKPTLFNNIKYSVKQCIFNILDIFVIIPICVVLTVFCFSYLFIITPVDGSSMMPTIKDGEQVFVSYNKKIQAGSIVILEVNNMDNAEVSTTNYYIKRVVGMPGETIEWDNTNKVLKINGIPKDYISQEINDFYKITDHYSGNLDVAIDEVFYVENGIKKYLKDNNYQIPEGYYFVMGDNRASGGSHDSRKIGLIKKENIIGVATRKMNYIIPGGKLS